MHVNDSDKNIFQMLHRQRPCLDQAQNVSWSSNNNVSINRPNSFIANLNEPSSKLVLKFKGLLFEGNLPFSAIVLFLINHNLNGITQFYFNFDVFIFVLKAKLSCYPITDKISSKDLFVFHSSH